LISFKRNWPLQISTAIFFFIVISTYLLILHYNNGFFSFVLDDPYIHLSMAKNFATHGVWGISTLEFSSSTSSPLWTLLLSFIFLFTGPKVLVPLIINIIVATLLIFSTDKLIKKHISNNILRFIFLFSIILFTPFIPLLFTGMEHLLHIYLLSLFLIFYLNNKKESNNKYLYLITSLLILTRYESVFFIFPIFVHTTFFKKSLVHGSLLFLFLIIPPTIYGLISINFGWYFFPNSIIVKTFTSNNGSIFSYILSKTTAPIKFLIFNPHILALFLISLITLKRVAKENRLILITTLSTLFFHSIFSKSGWFFRYEAYLIYLLMVSIITSYSHLKEYKSKISPKIKHLLSTLFLVVFLLPLFIRGFYSTYLIPKASINIYHQQIQIGKFLNIYYGNNNVILNDIGAASFYSKIKVIDLWGIAHMPSAKLRISNKMSPYDMLRISSFNKAPIAIIFSSWFDRYGGVSEKWTEVGSLIIKNNIICGDKKTTFYATNKQTIEKLRISLQKFSKELPNETIIELKKIH
jgi:hypothetical protein